MLDNEKFRKLIPYLIVFMSFCGIIILTVVMIDKLILPAMIHSSETVKVPNVIGKPLAEADKVLGATGLSIAKVSEQYSDAVAQGMVLNQSPKSGQFVKAARSIYLTVS
ncbi:MAG: PASTA domain-containing protein, partial [Ignavibacteria bacterium]|nr:PASTA domain-containing protein [Ignavibacteria bacterium]